MKKQNDSLFTLLSPGLEGHVARRGVGDRKVPDKLDESPPTQRKLEALTRSGLAQRGHVYYETVRAEHDPLVARAQSQLADAQARLEAAQGVEHDATEVAKSVTAAGPASDPSRQVHRHARAAQVQRQQAESSVSAADHHLAEVLAARNAAVAAMRQKGYEHLEIGQAAIQSYWRWVMRFRRRKSAPVFPTPSALAPVPWMTEDLDVGDPGEEKL
jgi:hypothetical protein